MKIFLSDLPKYVVGTGYRGAVEINPQDAPFVSEQGLLDMARGVVVYRTGLVDVGTARLVAA